MIRKFLLGLCVGLMVAQLVISCQKYKQLLTTLITNQQTVIRLQTDLLRTENLNAAMIDEILFRQNELHGLFGFKPTKKAAK